MSPRLACFALVLTALLGVPAGASAQLANPLNDLFVLSKGDGQPVVRVPTAMRPEPALDATPQVPCGPGSKPEPGIQGRVPAGSATNGLQCNVDVLGNQGKSGGFKVLRYIDAAGHECGYYDTALLFPANVVKADVSSLGVVALDMSDPKKPVQTDTLSQPPMLTPHESLSLNPKRGLLAAVMGNPSEYPGVVSIYDVSKDCRHPVLQSTAPVARVGHESGFSQDGRTFYATSTASASVTAVDVSDPKAMHALWFGQIVLHGASLNADGTRLYGADPNGQLVILDTSEIQARKPDPQVREISRLTWKSASIPQNAIPFTRDGKPYLLEIDEYAASVGGGDPDAVGAARIIDISDETQPRVIANLRLQVNQPEDHAAVAGDPGAQGVGQSFTAHYCDVSSPVDPLVVACSFIASGLRVFDISDLTRPKEIAYHVAPTKAVAENVFQPSSFSMSKPVIVPERQEVWYSDGATGFHSLRVQDAVWPKRAAEVQRVCGSNRAFTVRVRLPKGAKARSTRATLGTTRLKGARQVGRYVRLKVDLRGKAKQTTTLRIRVKLKSGKTVTSTRRYRTCTKRS